MRQNSLLLLTAVLIGFLGGAVQAETLKIVTFNTRWFGLKEYRAEKGEPQYPGESPQKIARRASEIKNLLSEQILPADAIVFEEVVDKTLIQDQLPRGWTCSSYVHPQHEDKHQHVVVCAAPQYRLQNVSYDDNNTIEEVAYDNNRGRPAVRVDLTTAKGRRLLRIVGVHLKAKPEFSDIRISQVTAIANDLMNEVVPTIVTGDFNSFPAGENLKKQSDIDIYTQILKTADPGFEHLGPFQGATFLGRENRGRFDHFFGSSGVSVVSGPEAFAACNGGSKSNDYFNQDYFDRFISDHCPVSVTINVK